MKNRLPQTIGACSLVAIVLATTSITAGQGLDTLVKAKALYAEASYDEALVALKGDEGAEAYQYRALCFLALGKPQDAERAIESLINVNPTFAVSDADLPPRLVTLFSQTRKRVMPGVIKRLFTEARADFQARNMVTAREKFEKVQTLTHDPVMADSPDAVDLQLLVASYIDILKTSTPAPVPAANPVRTGTFGAPSVATSASAPTAAAMTATPSAPVAAAAAPPITAPASATPTSTAATSTNAPGKADTAKAAATDAANTVAAVPRVLVPAVTVRQTFPSYEPMPGQPLKPMSGAVRITIGADGKVKEAVMEVPIDPRYDIRIVNAAKSWQYKPATLGGQPIQSEKIVQINISK